ncbi:TonB-dependent receptor [Blastomonas sp.]|uniref:TonB-dependent receptor n=1 Tax=Blastomonas sp. TaxID=1909299 RepID=UPI00391C25BF
MNGTSVPAGQNCRRHTRTALMATGAVLMLTMHPVAAHAAEQPDNAPRIDNAIDEIVVTARRRDENVQSVPISVSVLSNEVLESFRFEDLDNLQALEPSFSSSSSSGRPNAPVYSIRGIRPTEAIYGQDPTVAIYLADVVQSPAQGSNLGFYDLENIQVLKGPQGTLFGRNTIGGAVLLTPRAPGTSLAGDFMVGAGNFGLVETQIGLDLPLADTFQVRIAGRTIDGGDYQTDVTPGPRFGNRLGGQKTRSIRVTAVGQLTPDITNTIMVTYDSKQTEGRGTVLQAINPTHPNAGLNPAFAPAFAAALARAQNRPVTDIESDLDQRDDVEAWSISNTTTARLSDTLNMKVIAAYRQVDTDIVMDLDGTIVPGILTSEQRASLDHMSLEGQLLGTAFGDRLDWVVGGYYYREEGSEMTPAAFFGSRISQNGTVDNKSYSVFAQGSFKLTPELTLTAGGRLNRDDRTLILNQTVNGALCLLQVANAAGTGLTRLPLGGCEITLKDSFSQPTGTVALDYKITPDILVYATSRYGYRSGGFNLRASLPIQYEPFELETVNDFEVGTKADWSLGNVQMRTNLAVFFQKYNDIQRTVAVTNPITGIAASSVTNAASAQVFGIELQQTIKPTNNLTFQFNLVYNDPKYNDWIDPATNTDLSSTPFFFTPEFAGNALVSYEVPLPSNLGSLNISANAAYTDDIWINALQTNVVIAQHPAAILPLLRQEGYWLVDASVGWKQIGGSNFDLNLYVRNLTDTVYKVGGIQLYTGASGFISAAFGEPRTFGAQLRYRF